MSDMPNLSKQHAETLEAIVGQLEMNNTRTQQLTETVEEIPKVTRAQTETLTGINRQLEMTGEQNMVATQTMEKLGHAINTLGDSNNRQTQALQEMNVKVNEQHETLTQLVSKQSKRFTMLFTVILILAVAAITSIIVGVILWGPAIQN
jgi:predicted  nucleic acid-binding Zn-ribbon protein